MNQQTEKEIYQFMGRTTEAIENIEKHFENLPCSEGRETLDNHEKRIAVVEGRITTFSVVAGFIGSLFFALVSWGLGKIKF